MVNGRSVPRTSPQGTYWIATVARAEWKPCLPDACSWIKGQLESGASTGYEHWQFVFSLKKKARLSGIKKIFPPTGHYELTKSKAADDYVWKDETSLGSRFEYGKKPLKRNSAQDWDAIRDYAIRGELSLVPSDVYIRYYSALCRIRSDHLSPSHCDRRVFVLWGGTGTGKSHRAWLRWPDAYPKDPRSKWWSGYRDHETVIIDEFRGGIDISHMLRWFDKYPVSVETKGSAVPLSCKTFVVTSNLPPELWYPDVDQMTLMALMRRLTVIEVTSQEQVVDFE